MLSNGAKEVVVEFLEFTERLLSTVVVIRTYNNRHITRQVKNFLSIGVGRIIVVINAAQDRGATRGFLGTLVKDSRVQLIEIHEGYTWSNALNHALMAIQIANIHIRKTRKDKKEFRFIFNVSVESQFNLNHVKAMINSAAEDPEIGVVGTSFIGIQEGNEISLGISYRHPRNTGMLIRIEAFGPF